MVLDYGAQLKENYSVQIKSCQLSSKKQIVPIIMNGIPTTRLVSLSETTSNNRAEFDWQVFWPKFGDQSAGELLCSMIIVNSKEQEKVDRRDRVIVRH